MQTSGKVQSPLPAKTAEGNYAPLRTTPYGDLWLPFTPENAAAAEGSYFRGTNAAPGTAIAQAVTATFSATTPLLIIRNEDPSATGKTLYLDYIALLMTVIPASSTTWDLAAVIDPNNRYTSGGTALTLSNANSGSATTAQGHCYMGSPTTAAAVAARQLLRRRVFNVVPVVNSQLVIAFGAQDFNQVQTLNGANAVNLYVPSGPVALGPGSNHCFLLYAWYASNATTGASFEIEVGWVER